MNELELLRLMQRNADKQLTKYAGANETSFKAGNEMLWAASIVLTTVIDATIRDLAVKLVESETKEVE